MLKRDMKMLETFLDIITNTELTYEEASGIWNDINKNNYSDVFRNRLFGFFRYIYKESNKDV